MMKKIQNDLQYYVTCAQCDLLASALKRLEGNTNNLTDVVYKAMMAGIESQMSELRAQIDEYEDIPPKVDTNKLHQVGCTYTTFDGNTPWEALNGLANFLEKDQNMLSGISPCVVELEYHESDPTWTASMVTYYEGKAL